MYKRQPLLWLVSTSLKGPAEDIFSSPPALPPAQPSLDAYVLQFQDNPLTTHLFNSTVVSGPAVLLNKYVVRGLSWNSRT